MVIMDSCASECNGGSIVAHSPVHVLFKANKKKKEELMKKRKGLNAKENGKNKSLLNIITNSS